MTITMRYNVPSFVADMGPDGELLHTSRRSGTGLEDLIFIRYCFKEMNPVRLSNHLEILHHLSHSRKVKHIFSVCISSTERPHHMCVLWLRYNLIKELTCAYYL